jgi:hypothetical protein
VAVLAAVMAAAMLSALALAIGLLGVEESMLSSHDRAARVLRAASFGGIQLAVADLRRRADWSAALEGGAIPELSAVPARLAGTSLTPPAPWDGSPIDLAGLTVRVQAMADGSRGPADGPQAWRLFAFGTLADAAPGAGGPWYLVVWIADDRADTDGDPSRDSNGIVCLRAAALGPGEATVAAEATVGRRALPGGGAARVQLLTMRPGS